MRKRFTLLWALVVLGAALALPASTVAGSGYSYRVVYNYCDGNDVYFKAKLIAAGWTNANSLTIDSWAQRKPLGSGSWNTVYNWNQSYYNFAQNGQKHTLTAWRSYFGNSSYWFRIVFRLRAWHNNTLLATETIRSVKC